MNITRYALFLDRFEIEAAIGIHDFERRTRQRLIVSVEVEFEPRRLPDRDDIAAAPDYDWIRAEISRLVSSRHFELQETLAREIAAAALRRPEIIRVKVETAKPDVYPDARSVGCRVEASR